MDTPKWIRRRNLEVSDFKFILHYRSTMYYVITLLGISDPLFPPILTLMPVVQKYWSKIHQIVSRKLEKKSSHFE